MDKDEQIKELAREVEALKAELDRKFLLDCMAGKLTTFDQISGYVGQLERQLEVLRQEIDEIHSACWDAQVPEEEVQGDTLVQLSAVARVRQLERQLADLHLELEVTRNLLDAKHPDFTGIQEHNYLLSRQLAESQQRDTNAEQNFNTLHDELKAAQQRIAELEKVYTAAVSRYTDARGRIDELEAKQ